MAGRGGAAQVTTDHEFIRRWVEERGGCPAVVKRTRGRGGPGILRIDFPGYSGVTTLESIAWDDFFALFDEHKLAFLHQDMTHEGKQSRFSKLVKRDSVAARAAEQVPGTRTRRGTTARKRAAAVAALAGAARVRRGTTGRRRRTGASRPRKTTRGARQRAT
jgi:glutathione synthase/RimK-type ligase-like ATP-grasp enzyme